MALFGKAKAPTTDEPQDPGFSAEKAKVFFDRADAVHSTGNYEYGMQLWLQGIRWDPTSMLGLAGFIRSADAYLDENPKGKVSKETRSVATGPKGVGKFVEALLDFGLFRTEGSVALKAAAAAAELGVREPATFLGRHALGLAMSDDKAKKDTFVKLLDVLDKAEDFTAAAQAGDRAMKLDPADGELQARVRNMMAKATMTRGGFEDSGEGGFRKNIRDAQKQAELVEQESLAKTDTTKDAIVERTKAALDQRPDDLPTIEAYTKALLERAKPGDELKAMMLSTQTFQKTGQFRFRQRAGDIQLRLMHRSVLQLERAAKAAPDNAEAQDKLAGALKALRDKELEELRLMVENYPTDLPLKHRLAKVHFARGEYDQAIALFQIAESDARLRDEVRLFLGQSFQRLGGWDDAAIETYRRALSELSTPDSDLGMELRYGLMTALQSKAKADRDKDAALEADKIAAGIAIKNFSYKDIRERREAIKALLKDIAG